MLLVLVFVALITKEALAAQHIVGGTQGWDESTDFDTWASGQTFKVGDQLGMSLMLDSCKDILVLKNIPPLIFCCLNHLCVGCCKTRTLILFIYRVRVGASSRARNSPSSLGVQNKTK